jgi:hypothetical protein
MELPVSVDEVGVVHVYTALVPALLEAVKVAFGDEHVVNTWPDVNRVSVGAELSAVTENVFAVLVDDVTQPVTVFVTAKV